MDIVTQHKWQKFAKHPGDVNTTLVKESCANLADAKQHLVLVRALCHKKKVEEDQFDEVMSGMSGNTKEKLPALMGLKGSKAKENSDEHPQSGAIKNAMAKLEDLEESVKQT
ncbi:hypothetical protein V6N13_059308 [Hibiscus sabdariffa]